MKRIEKHKKKIKENLSKVMSSSRKIFKTVKFGLTLSEIYKKTKNKGRNTSNKQYKLKKLELLFNKDKRLYKATTNGLNSRWQSFKHRKTTRKLEKALSKEYNFRDSLD